MTTEYGPGTLWVIIIVVGLGTYTLRLSFILLVGQLTEVPATVAGVLRFVPGAVFAALVVPTIISLSLASSPRLVYEPAKFLAGSLAVVVAWRTENVLATIGVGMVTLWGVQLVV